MVLPSKQWPFARHSLVFGGHVNVSLVSGQMLLLIVSLKLLSELGLLALAGRWVLRAWLHRLHPHAISGNVFLALLDTVCRPWLWLAKVLSPRIVLPQHHPLVAGCLLCMLWLASTIAKIGVCVQQGLETCR